MKNKGFTLIELLAVIVILAIIALIATPIILNIINESQTSAKQRSQELVFNAVELAYQSKYALTGKAPKLTEVQAQLAANGINQAEINGNTITTDDGVVCTLGESSSKLTLTCEGATFEEGKAPELPDMTLTAANAG